MVSEEPPQPGSTPPVENPPTPTPPGQVSPPSTMPMPMMCRWVYRYGKWIHECGD